MWRWAQRMVWSACPPPRRACRRLRPQRLKPAFPYAQQRVLRAAARRGCTYRPVSVVARAAQARWAVARVCCGRQATGVTPTVHKVRFSSERGRCVTHWRSDGTTAPEAGAPGARARAVGMFYGGITRGGQRQSVAGSRALLPRPRRASRARVGAPSGPARASCPGEDHTRKNTSEHI